MNIFFKGEVGDNQSWGISTIGNVDGFLSQGCNVTIECMNRYGDAPENVRECIHRRQDSYDIYIRQGLAKHMHELSSVNKDLVRISLSCWDSDLVDEETRDIHNKFADGVFALSSFTKKAFEDAGVTIPIHIGGQGFDETVFYPKEQSPSDDCFTFLTVAVAQGRKGTHALINAFEKALGDVKDVKLIIKSNSWGKLDDYGTTCRNVHKLYAEHTRREMGDIYRNCDCFVLPTHGDSFALPGIEAMACGLPLVITDFGGPRDYCNHDTGYPIRYVLKDAGYLPGHQAEPSEEHLAELFYHIFTHQDEAKNKGENGAKRCKEYWTWKHDAIRNVQFLQQLIEKKRA